MIRDVKVPDLSSLIVEPFEGTALAHLTGGLFEAHARDESGYRDEGGHKQMWEAARDCDAALGEAPALMPCAEANLRVNNHDVFEDGHEKCYKSYAAFPLPQLAEYHLHIYRSDLSSRLCLLG